MNAVIIYPDQEDHGRKKAGERNQEFSFRHISFEVPYRHSRDVNSAVGYTVLELSEEAEAKIKIGHHHNIDI